MATICPNKNTSEWKYLADRLGENDAMRVFIANNYDLPSMKALDKIIDSVITEKKKSGNLDPQVASYIDKELAKATTEQKIVVEKILSTHATWNKKGSGYNTYYENWTGDKADRVKSLVGDMSSQMSSPEDTIQDQELHDNLFNEVLKGNDSKSITIPYMIVADEANSVAGTIDTLIVHPDGSIDIRDYKSGTEPDEVKLAEYTTHLSIYKRILEKNYGVKVNNIIVNHNGTDINLEYNKVAEELITNPFKKVDKTRLENLLDDVKVFVERRIRELERLAGTKGVDTETASRELNELKTQLESLNTAASINLFINEAYDKFYDEKFGALHKISKSIENFDKKSPKQAIDLLNYYNEFAGTYDILDDLKEALIDQELPSLLKSASNNKEKSALEKLAMAINAKETIKNTFKTNVVPYLAEILYEHKSSTLDTDATKTLKDIVAREAAKLDKLIQDKAPEDKINKQTAKLTKWQKKLRDANFSKNDLTAMINEAVDDESVVEYLFSPLISSSDPVLGLFAKRLKEKLEVAWENVKNFEFNLDKARGEFIKSNKVNKNNPAEFNKDIIEEVTRYTYDEASKTINKKTYIAYVDKVDVSGFSEARAEFLKSLDERNLNPKQRAQALATWFKNNKADVKYLNPKWEAIQKNPAIKKYYDFMLDHHLKLQEDLPLEHRIGNKLWSIRKDLRDAVIEGKGKRAVEKEVKSLWQFQSEDEQRYGEVSNSGKKIKFIPVYFTYDISPSDVSLDLYESALKATKMVERFKAMNDIRPEAEALKALYKDKPVISKNNRGNNLIDKAAVSLGITRDLVTSADSFKSKHLEDFIDMIIYGEGNIKWVLGNGILADKVADSLMTMGSISTLALDLLKGFANWAQGNIQTQVEAWSKAYYGKGDWLAGKGYYLSHISDQVADYNRESTKSLFGQLVDKYDPMEGEYIDNLGNNASGSAMKKLFSKDILFANMHKGEHELQCSMLFAMLHAVKVPTKEGEKALLDCYKLDNEGKIEADVDLTEEQLKKIENEIKNRVHALSKRMQGIYSDFNKAIISRYTLGRLVLMYRKFVVPGFKKRFKNLGIDQELGDVTEGTYTTFARLFAGAIKDQQYNVLKNWSSYTDFEKRNIYRMTAELGTMVALTVFITALKSAYDDDKEGRKSYIYNFSLYQALRLRADLNFYTPILGIPDMLRILKSPTAVTTQLERMYDLLNQAVTAPGEVYKRDAGIFKKGDSKLKARTMKLLGLSGNNLYPGEAVKILEMLK